MLPNKDASQKDTPTAYLELEQTDIYGKYILSAPLDILFVLRSMQKRGCMATVYFDHGKSFFLTWLLAIGNDEQHLILDVGSDEAINRRALKASRLIVSANLDHVKIQFALDGLQETAFEGRPAFLGSLPKELLRLQRREYFRLQTPVADPVRCQVPIRNEEGEFSLLDATVLDLSGGGASLMIPSDRAALFEPGSLHPDCRLQIPGESVLVVTLCVRTFVAITAQDGETFARIGCEFINLPGPRLTMIQRFITRIERERKAKLAGLE